MTTRLTRPATPVTVRELAAGEMAMAASLLGRGMRDNPLHLRAFGRHPRRRELALARLFNTLLTNGRATGATVILGAIAAEAPTVETLVGVCAMTAPGRCQASLRDKARLMPGLLFSRGGVGVTSRVIAWTSQWAKRDPDSPHWHLGPVGVDLGWQRLGVGTALLNEFAARMDALPAVSYLETDKIENVAFYERFGFQAVSEAPVLGVPNWFMVRTP